VSRVRAPGGARREYWSCSLAAGLVLLFVAPFERLRGKQFSQRLAADELYRIKLQLRIMLSQKLSLCTAAQILRDTVSKICEDLVMLTAIDLPYLEIVLLILQILRVCTRQERQHPRIVKDDPHCYFRRQEGQHEIR